MTKHPEWDEWEWLTIELPYSMIPGPEEAKHVYGIVRQRVLWEFCDNKAEHRVDYESLCDCFD